MAALHCSAWMRWYPRSKSTCSQRVWNQCQVTHIHWKRWVLIQPLPTIPPGWYYTTAWRAMVLEALRCFSSRPPHQYFMWLDFSGNQEFREVVALECL